MELPGDGIGISDILAYRDCPRRMTYGMKRHVGIGRQSDESTPESGSYATDYGSAIHQAIAEQEEGSDDDDAIQAAWATWGSRLDPPDIELLRDDLRIYRARDFPNTRTIASEDEFRVPLFKHNGRQIYFRFKVDRLYERLDQPGTFIQVDYKSSKWARSAEEVQNDQQMWAYNFGLHEYFPEIEQLLQIYDQLRYGQEPTRKSEKQREQMREWLITNITTILEDEDVRDDGLRKPKKNQWCAWCPIMESCPVIKELTEFALLEIAELAPRRPKKKRDGSDSKVMENVPLDPERLGEYVAQLEESKAAIRILERFRDSVNDLLRQMPAEKRAKLSYILRERNDKVFDESTKRTLHDTLGDRFLDAIKITKSGLESALADEPELLVWALDQAAEKKGATSVVRVGES